MTQSSVKVTYKDDCRKPLNIPTFLNYASRLYQAHYTLAFTIVTIPEDDRANKMKPRSSLRNTETVETSKDVKLNEKSFSSIANGKENDPNQINLILLQDKNARLLELIIDQCQDVPRHLLIIIGLCIPFHPTLNRITLHSCFMQAVCLYELSSFVVDSKSHITEIWLDGSLVHNRNYNVLLDRVSHLRVLSLARCSLDDDDVVTLTTSLVQSIPNSTTLKVLNLSTNEIGDKGGFAIGKMLRSNSSLQYLNLAGNRITSEGAIVIFKSLMEFKVTHKAQNGKLATQYLKHNKAVHENCLTDIIEKKHRDVTGNTNTIVDDIATLQFYAHPTIENIDKSGSKPLLTSRSTMHDDILYSQGNLVLNCINLSYNNLDYLCVPVLLAVLKYQTSTFVSENRTGLLRVQIEGNNLPNHCVAYDNINELIEQRYKTIKQSAIKVKTEKVDRNRKRIGKKGV